METELKLLAFLSLVSAVMQPKSVFYNSVTGYLSRKKAIMNFYKNNLQHGATCLPAFEPVMFVMFPLPIFPISIHYLLYNLAVRHLIEFHLSKAIFSDIFFKSLYIRASLLRFSV